MLQTLYLICVSLCLISVWQKDFSFHMAKLLFINWEWGKLRLQFCVSEIDVTAGAAVVLPPCCPLSCFGSGVYLILCWAVSVHEHSRKLLFALFFFFLFCQGIFLPAQERAEMCKLQEGCNQFYQFRLLGFFSLKQLHSGECVQWDDFSMQSMFQVAKKSNFPALWNQNKETVQCPGSLLGWSRRISPIPNPMGWPHAHKHSVLTSIWNSSVF